MADLDFTTDGQSPINDLAEAVLAPILAAERAFATQLSSRWDVAEGDISDAIDLRYQVVQKAEAILNNAGLLVDASGRVVAEDAVSATREVAEFDAARTLLLNALSPEERRYNCSIQQG